MLHFTAPFLRPRPSFSSNNYNAITVRFGIVYNRSPRGNDNSTISDLKGIFFVFSFLSQFIHPLFCLISASSSNSFNPEVGAAIKDDDNSVVWRHQRAACQLILRISFFFGLFIPYLLGHGDRINLAFTEDVEPSIGDQDFGEFIAPILEGHSFRKMVYHAKLMFMGSDEMLAISRFMYLR